MANLHVRDSGYYYDQSRYAFIAFAVAAVIIFITATCYVNFKRAKRGRAPVVSSFLAPPSYGQSQVAYEGQVVTNLPTYTADANPLQDVGYYDINGNFISADHDTSGPHKNVNGIELDDQQLPRVHTQQQQAPSDGVVYQRPPIPPPGRLRNTSPSAGDNTTTELPNYSPPPFNPFTPETTGEQQQQQQQQQYQR